MTLKRILKTIKSAESTISVFLGIAVVVVVGIMLFNYFRNYVTVSRESGEIRENIQTSETQKEGGETKPTVPLPTKYTAKAGDSLWTIGEKFYGSGYNWVDISRENKISQPNQIISGQVLTIPNAPVRQPVVSKPSIARPKAVGGAITGNKYSVVKGDTLWNISVRAYQDGFKWTTIAQANHLVNPSLIHPGNVLVIPR